MCWNEVSPSHLPIQCGGLVAGEEPVLRGEFRQLQPGAGRGGQASSSGVPPSLQGVRELEGVGAAAREGVAVDLRGAGGDGQLGTARDTLSRMVRPVEKPQFRHLADTLNPERFTLSKSKKRHGNISIHIVPVLFLAANFNFSPSFSLLNSFHLVSVTF